jgi:hypothetical protein
MIAPRPTVSGEAPRTFYICFAARGPVGNSVRPRADSDGGTRLANRVA